MERIRKLISHREQTALTDRIVQDYIVLVCDYCLLFYQRQFQSSSAHQSDLLSRFQKVLTDYYNSADSTPESVFSFAYIDGDDVPHARAENRHF